MSRIPIPVEILSACLDIAITLDLPVKELLDRASIDPDILAIEKAQVSADDISAVLLILYEHAQDPAFGLRYGEVMLKSFEKISGELFRVAGTMREVIHNFQRYHEIIIPHMDIGFETTAETATLSLTLKPDVLVFGAASAYELIWAPVMKFGQFMTNEEGSLISAHFSYPRPDYFNEYEDFFTCPCYFDADKTAFVFAAKLADTPLPGAFPEIKDKLEQQIRDRLDNLRKGNAIVEQVTEHLLQHRDDETYTIENIADNLHMTVRTLQRTLKSANTSVAKIKDQQRLSLARQLLLKTSDTIEEIAFNVGFTNAKTFHRAFKRWEGMSPGDYRKLASIA